MSEKINLIISAGMPRSASTWLYNAVRLLLLDQPDISQNFSSGWIDDWDTLPKKKYMLIKAHNFPEKFVQCSESIFYSYRDIRDSIASQQRKFGGLATIEWADLYISMHEKWMTLADFTMKYELMLQNNEIILSEISNILNKKNSIPYHINTPQLNTKELVTRINNIKYESEGKKGGYYNLTTLYHPNHITDGRHGAWKDTLSPKVVSEVEEKYGWWLEKYGYQI